MSYTPISSAEVASGQPISSTTMNTIKNDLSDHESRITTLEQGGAISYPPIIMRVNGTACYTQAITGILKTVANFDIRITGVRIYQEVAGSSGSTEIDLQVKNPSGSYTSVLTTRPTVAYTAGSDAVSTNAVINTATYNVFAGGILRLDVVSLQNGGANFFVRIDFVKV